MVSNKQNIINKIIYRSQYRGTKEMDIFVHSFVKSIIESLSIDELNDLNALINLDDEKIISITKGEIFDEIKNNSITERLINFKKNY